MAQTSFKNAQLKVLKLMHQKKLTEGRLSKLFSHTYGLINICHPHTHTLKTKTFLPNKCPD